MTKGFIINQSLIDSTKELSGDEFKEIIINLFNYAIEGTEPTFSSSVGNLIYNLYKPIIDNNNAKYDAKVRGEI